MTKALHELHGPAFRHRPGQDRFHPIGGGPKTTKTDKKHMVHGENRIPYWIDWRLTGLAGPEYHAIISFGLPFEPEYSQYGKSRIHWGRTLAMARRQYVYSLQRRGKTTYIGMTNSPSRRAAQHRRDGKTGTMIIERSFSSARAARRSEAIRLFNFRRKHGQNPQHNKTASGGWLR